MKTCKGNLPGEKESADDATGSSGKVDKVADSDPDKSDQGPSVNDEGRDEKLAHIYRGPDATDKPVKKSKDIQVNKGHAKEVPKKDKRTHRDGTKLIKIDPDELFNLDIKDISKSKEERGANISCGDDIEDSQTECKGDLGHKGTGSHTTSPISPNGDVENEDVDLILQLLDDIKVQLSDTPESDMSVKRKQIANGIVEFWRDGWIVDSLVCALEENLDYAWELYQKFKENVQKVAALQLRIVKLDTQGFIEDVRSFRTLIKDLELTDDIEVFINGLESSISLDKDQSTGSNSSKLQDALGFDDHEQEVAFGREAYLRGAYDEAEVVFRRILRSQPDDGEVASLLKTALVLKNIKTSLISNDPSGSPKNLDLVDYFQSGERSPDQLEFDEMTLLSEKTPEQIEELGCDQFVRSNYWGAAKYFTIALQVKPELHRAALRLKICHWKINPAS